jgi:hypothetical protein
MGIRVEEKRIEKIRCTALSSCSGDFWLLMALQIMCSICGVKSGVKGGINKSSVFEEPKSIPFAYYYSPTWGICRQKHMPFSMLPEPPHLYKSSS